MRALLLTLAIFQAFLFSKESTEADPYQLAAFGGEPSTVIGGCVSAITGNICFRKQDLIVNGKEPIIIERKYFSGEGDDYFSGWEYFFDSLTLRRTWPLGRTGAPNPTSLKIPEKQGFHLLYIGSPEGNTHRYRVIKNYPDSLTNCYTGEISGRLNTKNNRVFSNPKSNQEIIVEGADGSRRSYHLFEKLSQQLPVEYFRLTSEVLPNRNIIQYQWEKIHQERRLTRITTTSPEGKIYAWVAINYTINETNHLNAIHLKSSDGQELTYQFNPHAKQHHTKHCLLSDVFHPTLPNENITHWSADTRGYYLSCQAFPEGRYEEIDYYTLDDLQAIEKEVLHQNPSEQVSQPQSRKFPTREDLQSFFNESVRITVNALENTGIRDPSGVLENLKLDPRHKRVKNLNGPTGPQGERHSIYEFSYLPGKYKEGPGLTTVLNADGDATYYHYNKYFLIEKIRHCRGKDKTIFFENFYWHPYKSSKPNWLKSKTICDAQEKPLITYEYEYDDHGNVILEKMIGNLTGENNSETYAIARTFYPNNLLQSESFPNGKKVHYIYQENTDLITAKYIYDKNDLKIRYFYHYDDNVLVEEIIDDGISPNVHDLSGVSQRLIKGVSPHPETDLPHIISESYLDLTTHKKILLHKKVLHYNPHLLVERIDHYNSNDHLCYSITYKYDAKRRLIEETNPLGQPKTYSYDANNNITFIQNPEEPFSQTNTYDLANRQTSHVKTPTIEKERRFNYTYNLLGQKTSETDYQNNKTTFSYDPFNNITQTSSPSYFDIQTHQLKKPCSKITYNPLGLPLTESDPEGNITQKEWTIRRQPTKITYPDLTQESFIYDLNGNLIKHTNPSGTITCYAYDFLDRLTNKTIYSQTGELLSTESYTYNNFHLLSQTAPNGVITNYTYDGAGRKIEEKTLDHFTQLSYDALGRLNKTTRWINSQKAQVQIIEYDLLDRILFEKEEDQNGKLYSLIQYEYDTYGNQVSITTPHSTETYSYDSFKRPTLKKDPLGNITTFQYDDHYQKLHGLTYSAKTTIDPNLNQTHEVFNHQGQLIQLEKFSSKGEKLLEENLYYSPKQDKIKQVSKISPSQKEITKEWKYDSRSRVSTLIEEQNKITHYTYTVEGNLQKIIKPNQTSLYYSYDPLGRLIKVAAPDLTYSLTYDALGNISSWTDGQNTINRKWDHFKNLIQETLPDHQTLSYTYDPLNRLTSFHLPDHSSIHYTYDPYHLVAIDRLSRTKELLYSHQIPEYNLSHHPLKEVLPNGDFLTQIIDPSGRTTQTTSPYSIELLSEIDPNGNILEYTRIHPHNKEYTVFTYDALNQVTSESGLFNHTYSHDAHYNRLSVDDNEWIHDSLHQLLVSDETEYTYDPNGNLLTENTPSGSITYSCDSLNRLTSLVTPLETYTFTYDYWNRLLTYSIYHLIKNEWKHFKTESLLYQNEKEIGNSDTLRVCNPTTPSEIGATVAIEHHSKLLTPIHDLHGNIIALLDSQSQPRETYNYSIFGEEQLNLQPINPWRYQSKRKIAHLHYFGNRFYHPHTGRWITPDPKGFTEGPNLYQYNYNNPFLYTDHYGLAAMTRVYEAAVGITHGISDILFDCTIGFTDLTALAAFHFHPNRDQLLANYYGNRQTITTSYNNFFQRTLISDPNSPTYHFIRDPVRDGINYGLMATGVYALGKAGLTRASTILATRHITSKAPSLTKLPLSQTVELNRFHQAAFNLSETGQNNIRILRSWAKSKGWEKLPNPYGKPEKWGSFDQSKNFNWNLKIKPEASFREGLGSGSNYPRFDARLGNHPPYEYINPFTGNVSKELGAHIPLE